MQTETIEITGLPPGTNRALTELGRGLGKNVEAYLRDLIQTDLLSQNDIAQMAADPQIQAELRAIEQDFAGTEADGLEQSNGVQAKAKPPLDKRVPCEPMPDRTREKEWAKAHRHQYAGQWVALDGDRLVAASPHRVEISAAIKADSGKRPLILRIPSPDDLPYIGI